MKKTLLLLLILFIGIKQHQAQGWDWKQVANSGRLLKDNTGHLYVITNLSSDFVVEKFDTDGSIIWTKTVFGNSSVSAFQIDVANNLVLVGNFTTPFHVDADTLIPKGTQSFYILKLSPSSIVLSVDVYGSSSRTFANDIFINLAGEYLIGGGFSGAFDIKGDSIVGDSFLNAYIIKTDGNQNLIWAKQGSMYTSSGESFINEIVETTSGNIFSTITMFSGYAEIAGYQFMDAGKHLFFMDSTRSIGWSEYLEYPGSSLHSFLDLKTYADCAYMKQHLWSTGGSSKRIHRWTTTGVMTVRSFGGTYKLGYDVAFGKVFYGTYYNGYGYSPHSKIGTLNLDLTFSTEIVDTATASLVMVGEIQSIDATSFYAAINGPKVGKYTVENLITNIASSEINYMEIYPNPNTGEFKIELDRTVALGSISVYIIDLLGNCVHSENIQNTTTQTINIAGIAKGIYFIEVDSGNERLSKKIIIN